MGREQGAYAQSNLQYLVDAATVRSRLPIKLSAWDIDPKSPRTPQSVLSEFCLTQPAISMSGSKTSRWWRRTLSPSKILRFCVRKAVVKGSIRSPKKAVLRSKPATTV